jgi:hypothetical protein
MLLLEQLLEAIGKLAFVELSGSIPAEMPVQALGQPGQNEIEQSTPHGWASHQDFTPPGPQTTPCSPLLYPSDLLPADKTLSCGNERSGTFAAPTKGIQRFQVSCPICGIPASTARKRLPGMLEICQHFSPEVLGKTASIC